jgi:signal transduction histidine kinase
LREGEALAHVGSWSYDVGTGAVQWSAELHRMLDVDPLAFDGTLDEHLRCVHPEDRPAIAAAIDQAVSRGEPFGMTHRIVRADRATRHVYTRGGPVHGGAGAEVAGVRGIMQDVTEQHQASEAMRAAYERERLAAEDLRVAAAMKDDFLSIVSHELRTPLTTIVGFAALLQQMSGLDVPDLASRISRNAAEMQRMVERLLDFSRLQSGAVHIQLAALALRREVLQRASSLEVVLDAHELLVDVPDDIVVRADPDALGHVLTNLLSNAAKFSALGTSIEVRARRTGDEVLVEVSDHGVGIDETLREKVFEQFFQATPSPAGKRGAGVGLSIVARYVALQGGRVWCQSEPGKGSTFLFTLPAVS